MTWKTRVKKDMKDLLTNWDDKKSEKNGEASMWTTIESNILAHISNTNLWGLGLCHCCETSMITNYICKMHAQATEIES